MRYVSYFPSCYHHIINKMLQYKINIFLTCYIRVSSGVQHWATLGTEFGSKHIYGPLVLMAINNGEEGRKKTSTEKRNGTIQLHHNVSFILFSLGFNSCRKTKCDREKRSQSRCHSPPLSNSQIKLFLIIFYL